MVGWWSHPQAGPKGQAIQRERDEFGEADEFDYLVYREMVKEVVGYVEQGAEILYLAEEKYDPVEYAALVENKEWAKKLMQERTKPSTA